MPIEWKCHRRISSAQQASPPFFLKNKFILITGWLAQFLAFVALHERGCPQRDLENREIRNVTGGGEGT